MFWDSLPNWQEGGVGGSPLKITTTLSAESWFLQMEETAEASHRKDFKAAVVDNGLQLDKLAYKIFKAQSALDLPEPPDKRSDLWCPDAT